MRQDERGFFCFIDRVGDAVTWEARTFPPQRLPALSFPVRESATRLCTVFSG